jgi:hypothetical protein
LIRCAIAAVTMLVLGGHPALGRTEGEASPRCAGAGGLQFICGAEHPEDLAHLPGTRWMIASGLSVGAGLKLLDREGHTATTLQWTSAPMDGRYRLYVVNHGGRESIEIFDVAPGPGAPSLAWRGCVLKPACGGVRKVVAGKADDMRCHRGYVVASIDPRTLGFTVLAFAEPNPEFNGVSTAVIVADDLWLGSYQADRVAHRALPARGPAEIGSGSCKCGEGLRCP